MIRWPFSNLHTLNLDWLIARMKELEEKVKEYATNVSASATTGAPGSQASASVTGNLDEGLNFSFTIPRGAKGDTGATGATGPQGPAGAISNISYGTINLFESSTPIAAGGLAYAMPNLFTDIPTASGLVSVIGYDLKTSGYASAVITQIDYTPDSGSFVVTIHNTSGNEVNIPPDAFIQISYY